jgi:cytochrome c oxidase cbb3-type subunit 3
MSQDPDTPETDDHTGTATTGHEWDGIKELDTPLPRWWLYSFYATIVIGVVYMIALPAIPWLPGSPADSDHSRGFSNNSERVNVARAVAELQASRASGFAQLENASIESIENDPQMLGFVRAAGRAAFGDNCGTCHGVGAQGAPGYPNLNDDVWIWGGTFEDIRETIQYGIRTEHPMARFSQMPAYGRDQLLGASEIRDVADYVLTLSGHEITNEDGAQRGAEIFISQCASCHADDGTGDRSQGAPNLADQEWLYGGSREQIIATIDRGPYGIMPTWEGRLEDTTISALAAYVFLLGGGEPDSATSRPTGQ